MAGKAGSKGNKSNSKRSNSAGGGFNGGRQFKFESPSDKSQRYAVELSLGDNAFTGEKLNGNQASYRMGYLNSRRDSSKARQAYKRKHNKQLR